MYEALHHRLKPAKISIQLGTLDSILKQAMLQLSQAAFKIAPFSISIVEEKFEELMRDITSHKVDLAIPFALEFSDSDGFENYQLKAFQVHPCTSEFHEKILCRPTQILTSVRRICCREFFSS